MARSQVPRPAHERGARILLLGFTHMRQLDGWRRLALAGATIVAIGSILGIPDFGWVEAAQLLVAVSCLRVIARYVESRPYATPFADGTLLAVGGLWVALIALGNALFDDASSRDGLIIVAGCAALFISGMMIRIDEGRRWYEHDYAA